MDVSALVMMVYAKAFTVPRTAGRRLLMCATILFDFVPSLLCLIVLSVLTPACPTTMGVDGLCTEVRVYVCPTLCRPPG